MAQRIALVTGGMGGLEPTGGRPFPDDAPSPKLDALLADLPAYEGRHTLVLTHSKQFCKLAVARIADAGAAVVDRRRRNPAGGEHWQAGDAGVVKRFFLDKDTGSEAEAAGARAVILDGHNNIELAAVLCRHGEGD